MKSRSLSMVKGICFILTVFFCFAVFCILIKPEQRLISAGIVLVIGIYLWFIHVNEGKEFFFEQNYHYFLIAFLGIMGVLLFARIERLRFTPAFDLDAIFGGAIQWVQTGTFADYYDYFDWFPNNLGGLCFLYLLFKAFGHISTDYFLIAALANEVLILLTYTFISLTAAKLYGKMYGVLALMISGMILPFQVMPDAFYTDSLSMLFPVLLFYIYLKIEENGQQKIIKWVILFGMLATWGIFIKATVGIMVIAIGISLLLQKKWRIFWKIGICFCAIYMVFTLCFQHGMYREHLNPELAEIKNTPPYHWIMMGLSGDGSYNPKDYEFTRSFTNPEVRNKALKEEIRNRISEKGVAGMVSLYGTKLYRCLEDGTFGVSDFLDDNPKSESLLQQYVLYGGEKYHRYRSICNLFFYTCLVLMTAGLFLKRKTGHVEQENGWDSELITGMAVGGLLLFLMNWETSPRYITNYVPIIVLAAVGGCRSLHLRNIQSMRYRKWADWKMRYKKELKIFGAAVAFRIVIYLLSIGVMVIMGDYAGKITFSDFLEAWQRWDSAHYLNIAENGYAGAIENGEHIFLVFYPLYPWLIRFISLFAGDYRLSGILISVVCYAVGSVFFYKIIEREYDAEAAKNGLLLISIFPFSFFFGSIATESLFFAEASLFFYYLRRHDWNKVALFGFLACLTKAQGLLLAFSVLVELFYFKKGFLLLKKKKWKSFFCRIVYPGMVSAFMLVGFFIYLFINDRVEGNPLSFLYYQKYHWGNALCPIWKTAAYIIKYAINDWHTSTGMSLWVPEAVLLFGYPAVIWYGMRKKLRPMYLVYLITFFLLTYSSTWLISGGRYTISAFPVFMLGGAWLAKHEKAKLPLTVISSMLFMIYLIGYYSWKQIM